MLRCFVDVGPFAVAAAQTTELIEPSERPLDDRAPPSCAGHGRRPAYIALAIHVSALSRWVQVLNDWADSNRSIWIDCCLTFDRHVMTACDFAASIG
jgi:hypothetical protein